jgi:hypothetical protein
VFTESHEKNAFLSRLAVSEFALFRSHFAPLELWVGDSLHYCGERIDNIIFPNSGLVTLTIPLRGIAGDGRIVEQGTHAQLTREGGGCAAEVAA